MIISGLLNISMTFKINWVILLEESTLKTKRNTSCLRGKNFGDRRVLFPVSRATWTATGWLVPLIKRGTTWYIAIPLSDTIETSQLKCTLNDSYKSQEYFTIGDKYLKPQVVQVTGGL